MQQVVLREYFKSFNLSFVFNQPIVIRKLLDPSSVQHRILFQYFQTMSWTYQIPHQWKGDIRICQCLLPNTGITCAKKTSKHCFCYLHCNCKENISMCMNRKQDLLRWNYNLQHFSVFIWIYVLCCALVTLVLIWLARLDIDEALVYELPGDLRR